DANWPAQDADQPAHWIGPRCSGHLTVATVSPHRNSHDLQGTLEIHVLYRCDTRSHSYALPDAPSNTSYSINLARPNAPRA
ncbi:hypothetical protein HAX54_006729, partial [Datura stramonium]|nr:hypothetical protein [Datura stramonium]